MAEAFKPGPFFFLYLRVQLLLFGVGLGHAGRRMGCKDKNAMRYE